MKNRTLLDSFKNAFNGILHTVVKERNMKIHISAAIIVLIACMALKVSATEFLVIMLTIAAVFICELVNTAIENVVDIIVKEYHPKAKAAKDAAAGAVLVSAIISVVVGAVIFSGKIIELVRQLF